MCARVRACVSVQECMISWPKKFNNICANIHLILTIM